MTIEPLETRIAPAKIFAITSSKGLVSFDSATPGTVSATTTITGLQGGEVMKTIDFRPADGLLYGVAVSGAGPYTGRLYRIDTDTGAATAVGGNTFTLTVSQGLGSDFDPDTDELRVVAGTSNANFTLSPVAGAKHDDSAISGASSIAAIAYSDNYAGSPLSRLYAINYLTDDLYEIGGIDIFVDESTGNATKLFDVSVATNASTIDRLGFDILTTLEGSTAFYSGVVGGAQHLYTLDLKSGTATDRGTVGNGSVAIADIAAQLPPRLTFAEGKSFTYTDADGDVVTVKTSVSTLKPSQFGWLASADGTRYELTQMKIAGDATFTGANLSFTAKKTASGGDGHVNVGSLDASGVDLGIVSIAGNLERIHAGTNSMTVPAIKSFTALSMGRAAAPGDNVLLLGSDIQGLVPTFVVKGNVSQASIGITKANAITITGSILGGDTFYSGGIAAAVTKSFTLGGSLVGGAGEGSGTLTITGPATTVKIGGDIIGGDGMGSGVAKFTNPSATLTLNGSVIGGDGISSGDLDTSAPTLKIRGSIVGGAGGICGTLYASSKNVTISGSVITGSSGTTGYVSLTSPAVAKIGGSIVGGAGGFSGAVDVGTVGTFTLGGSITGGGDGGFLRVNSATSLTIGGNIIANDSSGTRSVALFVGRAQTVLIKGSVVGKPGAPALLTFEGAAAPSSIAESVAVKTLTINGSVINTDIVFGGKDPANFSNVNIAAGSIVIGGDFLSSSISAGFETGPDGFYGNTDTPAAADMLAGIPASIASIAIKGRASGTVTEGDFFGIVAERLDKVSIGGRALPLSPQMNETIALGTYADFFLRELAIP